MSDNYSNEGDATLLSLDQAHNFTDWMYAQIKPYLRGDILEIGSGIGTYSKKTIRDFSQSRICLSELDPVYCKKLSEQNFGNSRIEIRSLNLEQETDFLPISQKFDCAFALNVIEHVNEHELALKNVYRALRPGGVFIVLVPAHPLLFNNLDRAFGHYRRYTRRGFKELVARTAFKIEHLFMFNALSMLGWFVNGTLFRKSVLHDKTLASFNKLVPIIRPIETFILQKKIGISLIAVLKK
ncbi:MAG TPA: class I SAM-dependent methyltransferase [Candidatus Paceibacterota bacterium]